MATYYLYRAKSKTIIPLGETSFDKFYVEDGWYIFNQMVHNKDSLLNEFVVQPSDSKESMNINEFLDMVEKHKLMLDK